MCNVDTNKLDQTNQFYKKANQIEVKKRRKSNCIDKQKKNI